MNQRFVKDYYARFNEYPDYMAGETNAGVYFIKAVIERAGTTEADNIIEAMEKGPLSRETPGGWKTMRSEDHSVVEDCLWGQTSPNATYGFAIPKSFESIQGEEICRTDEELKAVREEYMKSPK